MADLKKAFPGLPLTFYDILIDRLKENGFTDQRLKDAIDNTIDSCRYPTPTVADVIDWDQQLKLYSYMEVIDHVQRGGEFGEFIHIKKTRLRQPKYSRNGWIRLSEADQYGIEL